MEQLKIYLSDKRKGDFARSLGIAPAYLSQILSGSKRPSFELMVRIDDETNGDVGLYDWIIPAP